MKKIVWNVLDNVVEDVDMTSEEETELTTHLADCASKKEAQANAEIQKANDQASGNQKFLDMGLTQAEATALTGYAPPVEE